MLFCIRLRLFWQVPEPADREYGAVSPDQPYNRLMAHIRFKAVVGVAFLCIVGASATIWMIYQSRPLQRARGGVSSPITTVGFAVHLYLNDNDDVYPLAFGTDRSGRYLWKHNLYVPHDWADPGADPDRFRASPQQAINLLLPYIKTDVGETLRGTSLINVIEIRRGKAVKAKEPLGKEIPVVLEAISRTPRSRNREPLPVAFIYNGLLSGLHSSAVANPATLPTIWYGRGKAAVLGGSIASPTLICGERLPAPCTYVPSQAGCSNLRNGEHSLPVNLLGSSIPSYAFAGGNARTISSRSPSSPAHTDWKRDPFTQYQGDKPTRFWTDGCHPIFFQPDFDREKP
jgi:hypothetical protein